MGKFGEIALNSCKNVILGTNFVTTNLAFRLDFRQISPIPEGDEKLKSYPMNPMFQLLGHLGGYPGPHFAIRLLFITRPGPPPPEVTGIKKEACLRHELGESPQA